MQWNEFRSSIRHLSTKDLAKVKEAFDMGEKLHKGQSRKSGEPYFTHPIAVAHMLADMGADRDTLIAALLHDTVEDTPATLEQIDAVFNGDATMLIDGVTKLTREDFEGRPTLDERIETLRKMFRLLEQDVRIMVIKLVDRLHNMQTARFLRPEDQRTLASETMDVYVKIADRLCMQDIRDELESLCLAILQPETFPALVALREKNEQRGQDVVQKIAKDLRSSFPSLRVTPLYEHRSWENLTAQTERVGSAVTGLPPFTCALLCENADECYRTLGALHQLWSQETLSFKDYINAPQVNGYQGLHTTIILKDGTRVRCKIRTEEMHAYARRGIVLECFKRKAGGVLAYLQWTNRIAPLAEDTKEESDAFWQSLQSDILGESIVIHGPGDETIYLPSDATALDAAFYLFGEKALRLLSIRVNGAEVPLHTTLKSSDALDATLANEQTVRREWLEWARTGLAMAKIRAGISAGQSKEEKIATGRALLQQVMHDRRRGFIEEFREESFAEALGNLEYSSLESAYVAIAEGHLDPHDLYTAIFEKKKRSHSQQKQTYVVRYLIDLDNLRLMEKVNGIHRRHGVDVQEVNYRIARNSHKGMASVTLTLTTNARNALEHELKRIGIDQVDIVHRSRSAWMLQIVVILLWGMDPVVAYALLNTILQDSLSPLQFTFIRFVVFFFAAAILYFVHTFLSRQKLKPISPFRRSLFLSGVALFVTGFSTYAALRLISPMQYILLIITGGVTFVGLARAIQNRRAWLPPAVVCSISLISFWAISQFRGFSLMGFLLGLLSGVSFGLYTEVSRRYQEDIALVKARYPAYLLWVSLIPLCLSVPFFVLVPLEQIAWGAVLLVAIFVLLFVFLPYALYYFLLRSVEMSTLDRHLIFVCIATMFGELLITQSALALLSFPVFLALLWWQRRAALRSEP